MLLPNCGPFPQMSHTCAMTLLQTLIFRAAGTSRPRSSDLRAPSGPVQRGGQRGKKWTHYPLACRIFIIPGIAPLANPNFGRDGIQSTGLAGWVVRLAGTKDRAGHGQTPRHPAFGANPQNKLAVPRLLYSYPRWGSARFTCLRRAMRQALRGPRRWADPCRCRSLELLHRSDRRAAATVRFAGRSAR